jgi:diguanylate cyclase (GGDEF)-like protein
MGEGIMTVPLPSQEAARLAALRQYAMLDTPAEAAFDDLARLASQICGTPIALISLIDARRLWFKARIGWEVHECPRADTFCDWVCQHGDPLIIPETLCDARFARSPLVLSDPQIRFYAGVPLTTADGHILGTLCVMDRTTRQLRSEQMAALAALGRQVIAQVELRQHIADLERTIAERVQVEEQLLFHTFHDALTAMPNRSLFLERLASWMTRTKQSDSYRFAVLFLDLDNFKVINDSLGHMAGDQLLAALSQRLQACLRPEDFVARFGGDEFGILLDEVSSVTDAIHVIERVQENLTIPLTVSGQEVVTTVSIGVVLSSCTYEHPEEMLRDADTALHRAKALGRARYEVFDRTMHISAVTRLNIENALRRALERGELLLHYQPQILLDTGKIIGVEALMRWQHPQHGLVSPAEFIPVAEETGLIVPIGEWGLREACRQTKAWSDAGLPKLRVAVNLSARQFKHRDITRMVAQILAETGLDPSSLELELTESDVMEHAEASIATMHELKQLGVQLAIDDFGTGYSSLSYLTRFPIDTLKIDKSFVQHSTVDSTDMTIVKAIIAMARHLHVNVIAEGVETEAQRTLLSMHQCDAAQGYLFSRPLSSDLLAPFLQNGRQYPYTQYLSTVGLAQSVV